MKRLISIKQNNSGRALVIVCLVIGIVIMAGVFAVAGYLQHLKDVRMTFDSDMVDEAEDCCIVQYLSDGCPDGGVTYYYDHNKKRAYNSESFTWKVNIEGYGLSYEDENLNGETGAIGIPNLGGDDGAQFLAIEVKNSGDTVHARWQGALLTEYDLTLMTERELENLTVDQKQQIDYTTKRANEATEEE